MYVSSEMIQHLKSQRRSMRRRVEGEKVHDGLGQKIILGYPFFLFSKMNIAPSFWSVTHNGPWCLEGPPERRPRMMRTVPTTMPTRPTVNPKAQTTVSVSSDIGAGISGSQCFSSGLSRPQCSTLQS